MKINFVILHVHANVLISDQLNIEKYRNIILTSNCRHLLIILMIIIKIISLNLPMKSQWWMRRFSSSGLFRRLYLPTIVFMPELVKIIDEWLVVIVVDVFLMIILLLLLLLFAFSLLLLLKLLLLSFKLPLFNMVSVGFGGWCWWCEDSWGDDWLLLLLFVGWTVIFCMWCCCWWW